MLRSHKYSTINTVQNSGQRRQIFLSLRVLVPKMFQLFFIVVFIVDRVHLHETPKIKPIQARATSIENSVTITAYNRNNRQGTVLTINNDSALTNSRLDFNKYTPSLTHGWNNNITSEPNIFQLKDAYLAKYDCNVLILNWTKLAGNLNETVGVTNTGPVGEYYGQFLNYLISKGANAIRFHLVGHSLGAHVSGLAAFGVFALRGVKIFRVTGLDASRRYTRRLAKSDAIYVDLIHTSDYFYGIAEAIGLADFYPVDGKVPQPGCGGFFEEMIACSSYKSIFYFKESIQQENKYVATRCTSYEDYKDGKCSNEHVSYMGEDMSANASGKYYLSTY